MYLATIDCGTTNTRVFIVDQKAKVLGKASSKVGVRDTAISGSKAILKKGIKNTFADALADANLTSTDIDLVVSSGMITSEIGLIEIPHLWAPVGLKELAGSILKVDDPEVVPLSLPIHFIRGIKNYYDIDSSSIKDVGLLDFMRGEETQIAGLLSAYPIKRPVTVIVLSSHTKFISVDLPGKILGSITTLSGQTFEAIIQQTFIGKSIQGDTEILENTDIEYDIVDNAHNRVREAGFLRTLLMPRFLDVLLNTRWQQRRLFVEAAIASEDMRAIGYFSKIGFPPPSDLILIGDKRRCRIYEHLLRENFDGIKEIFFISTAEEIDSLSIKGAIHLAQLAGLIDVLGG